ncbi:SCP-like protein [Ancylostoma caninum]|uniref:SCP-like protein n=1 Tax=Ancylostoma caninum TaxID=29170 RepID=A0A368H2A1_ANCCA|nr:SCP-like protein [Ancylostoma caninum]
MLDFNDSIRLQFLAMHNGYRSLLALGHVNITEEPEYYDFNTYDSSYYDSLYAPSASKMRYLKYDCEAEKSAYKSASNCSDSSSPSEDYDENKQIIENSSNISEAALKAIISWAREASNLNKTGEEVLYQPNLNISNFANLAWDTREKFGCAVAKCPLEKTNATTIHVVCHYPKINKTEGEPIYTTGMPCRNCSDYADEFFCHADEGVCVMDSQDLDIRRRKYFYRFWV